MHEAYISVRSASKSDVRALVRVFRDSWQNAYRGIIPYSNLDAMIRRRDASYWQNLASSRKSPLILEVNRTVAGYATFGRARRRGPYQGEIYELYLAPVYQGLGFGEYLFESSRQHLDASGARGLVVWALSDNEPACEFYMRRGGTLFARTTEQIGGVDLPKTAFAWQ